jgi:hypothetical protein
MRWHWAGDSGEGRFEDRFDGRASRMLEGKRITRGPRENPACPPRQDDGDRAIQRGSGLRRA